MRGQNQDIMPALDEAWARFEPALPAPPPMGGYSLLISRIFISCARLFEIEDVEKTPVGIAQQAIVNPVQPNHIGGHDHRKDRNDRESGENAFAPGNPKMFFQHLDIFACRPVTGVAINARGTNQFSSKEEGNARSQMGKIWDADQGQPAGLEDARQTPRWPFPDPRRSSARSHPYR